MMTARFFSWASLFALLIVDICCLPVKKGFNPSASHTNNAAATNAGVQREPAGHLSASSSSGPALFGHWGHSYPDADSSAHSGAGAAPYSGAGAALYSGAGDGAALQPHSRDMNWAVAPLSTFSAGEERSAGAYGVGSSGPVNVSPAIYPPPPAYQAGEMSNLEEAFEHGNYETETEDQGFYSPPRPMQASAGQAFTSQPQPGPGMGGYWGRYPYYDYMFVTGQYPPGTYTDFSASNEQGFDNWEDAHYRRYYPAQVTKTSAVPQRYEDPRPAVKAPYGKGGAAAGRHNLGKILSFLHIRLRVIHQQLSIINSLGSDWSGLVFGNIYNPSHLTVSLLLAFNMMTARFFSGASLFALLIVDICCLPVKKGFNPSASHTNNAAATNAGVQREPAGHLSASSSSSGPALFGHWGHSYPDAHSSAHSGAGAAPYSGAGAALQPYSGAGAALQPHSRDMNWAVAPLSTFSAGEERSAGAYGVGSSGPVNVSPAIYPPPPVYQAGEMSNLEEAFEHGNYETETEDQGFYSPPRPMQASAGQAFTGQAFTSQSMPGPGMGGYWGRYPYYDYMFVKGQYPPGTYTDFSVSNEQGLDNWEDAHYRRYYPAQETKTSAVPQRFEDPRPAVKAPYGKGL
ncbi:protein PRRC2A-like [Scomber scombrus]|uniref:Protein PRRC2A-like n=1 Tax=Scomber scombrus TaxID=13677 RepID=A0AAV1PYU4_SCOSC